MKIKNVFWFLLVFCFLGTFTQVSAEAVNVSSRGPVIASVGIKDAKIVSQDKNNIKISFRFTNGTGVQTGVGYSLRLIKEKDGGQFVVDEKIYNDSLTLTEKSSINKEIEYIAPSNIEGEYLIFITAKNEGGLMLSTSFVDKVNLSRLSKGIEVLTETCYLTIPEEQKPYKRYTLNQGVDINQNENLQLNCTVFNSSDDDIIINSNFETYFRSLSGQVVSDTSVRNFPMTIEANKTREISVFLPKALKPQAYDVKVNFRYNNLNSNPVLVHYVIQGVSATIQNLSLDKDYYKKGDTANIFFSWTGSADGFPYSRLGKPSEMPEVYFSSKITNNLGLACSKPIKKLLGTDHNTLKNDIPVSITRNCKNPKLDVSLVDKDGNVLDSRSFKFETKDNNNLLNNKFIMIISVIILLIIIFIYLTMKKKICFSNFKNKFIGPMIIFLTLFLGIAGLVFATESTEWVLAINGGGGGRGGGGNGVVSTGGTGTPPAGLTANFNFDKSAYNPSSSMRIDTTMYYQACTNATRNIVATGYVNGNLSGEKELFRKTVKGTDNFTGSAYFTSPATKGDYTFKVEVKGYHPDGYKITDAETDKGTSYDFGTFKDDLLIYIQNNYPAWVSHVQYSILSSTSYIEINEILNSIPALNKIVISTVPGALDFTRSYDLTFSVIEPTVQVFANEERPSTTINPNADVYVKWDATDVTSCTCEYSDDNFVNKKEDCTPKGESGETVETVGTGIKAREYPYRNISTKTVFKVICQ